MISFTCTHCGKLFQVGDEFAGRMGKCKVCGTLIFIPSADLPRPEVPPTFGNVAAAQRPATTPGQVTSVMQPQVSHYAPQQPLLPPQPYPAPQAAHPPAAWSATAPAAGPTPMRIRRLQADAGQMQKVFANFPPIRVKAAEGSLPEKYMIEYWVRGLVRGENGSPVYKDHHFAEIQLTSEYPRQSPKCRMLTPIFHPNIEPATICVGDHWTAGERLVDLVIRIAEMIAYQAYNIKSPLDGEAAMWADQHRQHLPTDHRDMHPAE